MYRILTSITLGAARRWMCGILCVLLLGACQPDVPSGILSEDDLEEVLYDYHLAQGAAENTGGDMEIQRYLYVQSVFQKHGITEAEFDSSMVWYSSRPDKLYKMYQRLGDRYATESRSLGLGVSETELYANMSSVGDTANIWSGSRILVLECNRTDNLRMLHIKADSTFLPGDDYKLSFSSNLLGDCREAYAMLNVTYKDGKTSSSVMRLMSSPRVMMDLPQRKDCEDYETERICITFYVPLNLQRVVSGFLCISNPALLRMHRVKTPAAAPKDSVQTQKDSLALDSLGTDSLHPVPSPDTLQRLTPEEMRNRKVVKKQINITDERPMVRRRARQLRQPVRRTAPTMR